MAMGIALPMKLVAAAGERRRIASAVGIVSLEVQSSRGSGARFEDSWGI